MFFLQIDHEVVLKEGNVKEAEIFFQLTDRSRAKLSPWLMWVNQTHSVKDAKEFLKMVSKKQKEHTDLVGFIWYRNTMAGSVALYDIKWHNKSASIGYWVGSGFEGRGIAKRGAHGMLLYAFYQLGLNRIELRAAGENTRSIMLAERLGFTPEGRLRQAEWINGSCRDLVQYSLLREDAEKWMV
ncbi:GNAT family N-acetyltransferase [Fictibacillus iocasae]|uniref:GNAT family N-acetyltransferase n=1 Tax=Fictibacillus iocasae TaxID=2715437 RepID=A0ABW2NT32_9BACL